MEGYLFKKGRGDSSLGRRNWKQRWFVLDQQELSYYDDFDLNSGLPSGFKGKVNITGCEAYPVNHHDKKNTFVIIPKNDKEILFQAPDPKLMNCKCFPLFCSFFDKFAFSMDERNIVCCKR